MALFTNDKVHRRVLLRHTLPAGGWEGVPLAAAGAVRFRACSNEQQPGFWKITTVAHSHKIVCLSRKSIICHTLSTYWYCQKVHIIRLRFIFESSLYFKRDKTPEDGMWLPKWRRNQKRSHMLCGDRRKREKETKTSWSSHINISKVVEASLILIAYLVVQII